MYSLEFGCGSLYANEKQLKTHQYSGHGFFMRIKLLRPAFLAFPLGEIYHVVAPLNNSKNTK